MAYATKADVKKAIKKVKKEDMKQDERSHEKRDSKQMVELKKKAAKAMVKKKK